MRLFQILTEILSIYNTDTCISLNWENIDYVKWENYTNKWENSCIVPGYIIWDNLVTKWENINNNWENIK